MADYVVKKGDTLSAIAKELLGDSSRWQELLNANPSIVSKAGDPTTLKIGASINVPIDSGEGSDVSSSIIAPPELRNQIQGQPLNGLPGEPEVWEVDGTHYITLFVEGTEPPVPMVWEVSNEADLEAFFGPGQEIIIARSMDLATFNKSGAFNFGYTNEIPNDTDHPFELFLQTYEQEALIRPWLLDPEMLALHQMAIIEGRSLTEAEYKTTNWWKTHNQAQRDWLALNASDPATADALIQDNEIKVRKMLEDAGIAAPSDDLTQLMASNFTTGVWSDAYLQNQIDALLVGDLGTLDDSLIGIDIELQVQGVQQLRDTVRQWLGPAYAQTTFSEDQLQQWAAEIQSGNKTSDQFIEQLSKYRVNLMNWNTDATQTYEDIATPWRGQWSQIMGQAPDETDPEWMKALSLNELQQFNAFVRKKGLQEGNDTVRQTALNEIQASFGDQVLRSIV